MTLETITITGLPNASTPLTGTERVAMDQGGQTKDAPASAIAALTTADDVGLGATDSPTFAGLTITGTGPVLIPHIHGTIAGNFYIHVRNTSGGTLAAGTCVRVTGSVGDTDRLTVSACDPTDPTKMPAIGILETSLANNGDGNAIILGELRPFNTNSFTLGRQLHVGAAGVLTDAVPTSGVVQSVGSVARVNASTGTVAVTIGSQWPGVATGTVPGLVPAFGTPGADRLLFYDHSAGTFAYAELGPGVVMDATTLRAEEWLWFACSDEVTALTVGTAKLTFRMPYPATLLAVRANVKLAPTGANLVVDINEEGSSVLSTKLSVDASEKTSTTAATAAVISDSALADDAEITIDIDQVGSTVAGVGLKVGVYLRRA